MKINIVFKVVVLTLGILSITSTVSGQKKKKASSMREISGKVVDGMGQPIRNATVTSGEGSVTVFTDAQGQYTIKTKSVSAVLVEAEGYETEIVYLLSENMPPVLELVKTDLFASSKDVIHRVDGGNIVQRDNVGAVSKIDVEKIKRYPDLSITNSLQGLAAGLIVRAGSGGLGNNFSSLFIRGQHTLGGNGAVVIVDGLERSINDLLAEEIESIEILKDATAKVLYGASAANGVVLVTTKRGQEAKKIIRTSVEYGVFMNTRVPDFLGSYDYTRLYNEARENDGLKPLYSAAQIEGYKNSKGENDPLYPNVDWYKKFLHSQSTFTKATIEFNGGNNIAQYALVAGYMRGQGLEKIGKRTATDQFNLRGNLNINVSKMLTVKADVSGRMYIRNRAIRGAGDIMSTLSSNKPNEYPLTISPDILGLSPAGDGVPYFGGSNRVNNNLFADLAYSGKVQDRYTYSQVNLGLDFNLVRLTKGLSAGAYVTFDNYSEVNQKLENTYSTYSLMPYFDQSGVEQIQVTKLMTEKIGSTNHNITGQGTLRVFGWRANIGYENTFNAHSISAILATRYSMTELSGVNQDKKNFTHTLRLNYDYDKKYLAEVALAYMGSNAYTGAQKYFFAPTVGLGWIISKEDFMAGAKWVDFLKVKVSAGILGYDGNANYDRYSIKWQENGTRWQSGETNNTVHYPMNIVSMGNPNLKWERSNELNVGVEALFLSQRLRSEVNYFVTKRQNIIRVNSILSSALGDFTWLDNVADVTNQGVDAHVSWSDRTNSNFGYRVGVNFTYSRNKINSIDEAPGMESYRSQIGRSTDAIITHRYAGLFGKDVNMITHPSQTFGYYTDGDIAYKDINGDNIIDGRDQEEIGSSFPTTTWGVDMEFNYRGFGLYVLATAETNVMKLLNTSYHRNVGENNYSTLARDRYHPVNNPTGTQPRLTTSNSNDNSYRNSEFWYGNAGFFRLKNVELSYTFEDKGAAFYSSLKLFVRGTNLFVLSPMKDLDPERMAAGIDNYPAYRAITGGVSITF